MDHKKGMQVIQYHDQSVEITEAESPSEINWKKIDPRVTTWIILNEDFSEEEMVSLTKQYSLHPLIIEDVLQKRSRPALEDYDDGLFIVSNCLSLSKEYDLIDSPIYFYLTGNVLISFFSTICDYFEPIMNKLKNGKPRSKKMKADFLLNLLLDYQVDNYLILLEKIGDKMEMIQDDILEEADSEDLLAIQHMRTVIYQFLRVVWPMREMINLFVMDDTEMIADNVKHFYRDIHSHLYQVADTLETYREMLSSLMDIYLTSINNHMNQIMKILTIVSTLFMPLGFITGLYGMNFKFMPELDSPYGYPVALVLMLVVSISMLLYFRKKKWL
jgi:magnesium transporter